MDISTKILYIAVLILIFVIAIVSKSVLSLTGSNSFTIVVNPYIVGIDAKIEPNPANWFDRVKVSGWSVWPNGDPFNQTIEVYYNELLLCRNQSKPEGYFECYFTADENFTLGEHIVTIYAVNSTTGKVLGAKDILFKLYPHFGKKPKNNIVVIDVPSITQDIDGKIKKVIVKIFFGY